MENKLYNRPVLTVYGPIEEITGFPGDNDHGHGEGHGFGHEHRGFGGIV